MLALDNNQQINLFVKLYPCVAVFGSLFIANDKLHKKADNFFVSVISLVIDLS